MKLSIDIESYSECDLRKSGLYRYAADATTELLVVCYAFDEGPVQTWWPPNPAPQTIIDHIKSGQPVHVFNAQFERVMLNALGPKYGLPKLEIKQMRCTAAKVANAGLPRNLGDAAKALGSYPKS